LSLRGGWDDFETWPNHRQVDGGPLRCSSSYQSEFRRIGWVILRDGDFGKRKVRVIHTELAWQQLVCLTADQKRDRLRKRITCGRVLVVAKTHKRFALETYPRLSTRARRPIRLPA